MKAVTIAAFNCPLNASEVPAPTPGDGEVLVDVDLSSINGLDAMIAAGYIEGMMPYEMPITLGRDFSGTVTALGAVPNPQMLSELAGAFAQGSLRVPIGTTYDIDQVTQAMTEFGSGSLGKISIAVRQGGTS